MPAFGINLGTIAQQGVQSYRDGYDRSKELAAKERQAQMDRENLRARGLSNDVLESEAADRLEAIRIKNESDKQVIGIRGDKAPVEKEILEGTRDRNRQAIAVTEEQRDPRLQALIEENRHNKVSNPLSEQAQRIDNQGRVLNNQGKVIANSIEELREQSLARTGAIESATQSDKLNTAVNNSDIELQRSENKLENVGDQIALDNATVERDISQAGADQSLADKNRTVADYENLEAKAKLTVTKRSTR